MKKFKMVLTFFLAIICFQFSGKVLAATAENSFNVNDTFNNHKKSGDIGLGLMLGSTSGITAKAWTSETTAIDAGISFSGATAFMADYLWHWRNAFTPSRNNNVARSFVPYLGLGLIGGFGGNTDFFYHDTQTFGLGARVPIGIEFIPAAVPMGIFVEIEPGVGFIPNGFTFIGGNLGGRYYF